MDQERQLTGLSRKETGVSGPSAVGESVYEEEEVNAVDLDGGTYKTVSARRSWCPACGRVLTQDATLWICTSCREVVLCDACAQVLRCASKEHNGVVCPACRVEWWHGVYYCREHAKAELRGLIGAGVLLGAVLALVLILAKACL